MEKLASEPEHGAPAPTPSPPKFKPAAKRTGLQSSNTGSKFTLSSSAKPTTTPNSKANGGTTLSKPPSRPHVSSTFMKPTASSINVATGHKPRGSIGSQDDKAKSTAAADDQKPKSAFGAPKRLSTTVSATSIRQNTDKNPATQATPNAGSTPGGRTSTLSPAKAAKPSNVQTKPTPKSRPSAFRANVVNDGKKRLSTIPASPATKDVVPEQDGKENDQPSASESARSPRFAKPILETSKSTRSDFFRKLIEEYELVNSMLQAAIEAEDAGNVSQTDQLTRDMDEAVRRLKANLEANEEASSEDKSAMPQEPLESMITLKEHLQLADNQAAELKEEVDQLKKAKEADVNNAKQAADKQIAELKEHINQLTSAREAEVNDLNQSANKTTAELKERIEQMKAAKEIEVSELNQCTEKQIVGLKQQLDEVNNIKDTEVTASKQSADTRNTELKEEINQLKREKDRKEAEINELKHSADKQVAGLKEHIEDMKAAENRSSEESAASEWGHREETERQAREISKLNEVIERLQDEIQATYESKTAELDEKLSQTRHEDEEARTALRMEHRVSLDGLAQSHNAVVEKLALEAQNTRTTHERQTRALKDAETDAQQRLKETTIQLNDCREEMQSKMGALQREHAAAVHRTKERTEADHAAAVKELERKIGCLESELSQSHNLLRTAWEDLKGAQHQVDSLKQLVASFEKEGQMKEELHNNTLEKVITEAQAANKALSEYSANIEVMQAGHTNAVQALQAERQADLEKLGNDLSRQHREAYEALKMQYDSLSSAQSESQTQANEETQRLRQEHARALSESVEKMARLKQDQEDEISRIKAEEAAAKDAAMKNLEKEWNAKLSRSEKEHASALEELHNSHQNAMLQLKSEMEETAQQMLSVAIESDKATVADCDAKLDKEKKQITDAEQEVEQASNPADVPEMARLTTNLENSKGDLSTAQAEIAELKNEVAELKERKISDQDATDKGTATDETGSRAQREASRGVYLLKEQLEGALQEAEIQREGSDAAQRELSDSQAKVKEQQARIEELESKLHDGNVRKEADTKPTTPQSSRRRHHRQKSSKSSPHRNSSRVPDEDGMGSKTTPGPDFVDRGASVQGAVS